MTSPRLLTEQLVQELRDHGHRVTPQRRAILAEILSSRDHINPAELTRRVQERVPGVNAATVYRTLWLLDELGVISHAHLEEGVEYHPKGPARHVHLTCSSCGKRQSVPEDALEHLLLAIEERNGFFPDFTHFAIGGTCRACRKKKMR